MPYVSRSERETADDHRLKNYDLRNFRISCLILSAPGRISKTIRTSRNATSAVSSIRNCRPSPTRPGSYSPISNRRITSGNASKLPSKRKTAPPKPNSLDCLLKSSEHHWLLNTGIATMHACEFQPFSHSPEVVTIPLRILIQPSRVPADKAVGTRSLMYGPATRNPSQQNRVHLIRPQGRRRNRRAGLS